MGRELKHRQYWLSDCLFCKNNTHSKNTAWKYSFANSVESKYIVSLFSIFLFSLLKERSFRSRFFDLAWLFLVLWVNVLGSYLRCTVTIIATTLLGYYQIGILYCWSSTLTLGWNGFFLGLYLKLRRFYVYLVIPKCIFYFPYYLKYNYLYVFSTWYYYQPYPFIGMALTLIPTEH
jgi:hypothetical protein